MPSDWVDLEDALEQARDMVTTAMVTITPKSNKLQVVLVEIHGVEEMYKLVDILTKSKAKKKIKNFKVENLSQFQTVTVEELTKGLGKV